MRLGVVTTSYPRHPGDAAGSFVAGHVAALRALGHTVEVIAAGATDDQRRSAGGRFATGTADDDRLAHGRGAPAGDERAHDDRDARRIGRARAGAVDRTPNHRFAASARSGGAPDDDVVDDPDVHRVASRLFYTGGAPDRLEGAPLASALDAAAFTARLAAAVARRARAWDAIIAHWLVPSAIAALPARLPLTAIAHGGDVHTLRRLGLLAPVLRLLHARGARLAFVTAELRALAAAADPRAAAALVQPMGLPLAHFAALGRAPTTPPTILVAARLVAIKGVDVALAALDHLATDARLVIAGDGPERARLPAHPRATFVGEVPAAERDALLRAASVVVVPSRVLASGRTEGIPTIALEALAAGVPVVASAVGGLRERDAIALVPPADPRALARAIDRVLADPPPPAVLRGAVADLDWPAVARRLLRSE